jgi:uncharacterized OsmC-like protein
VKNLVDDRAEVRTEAGLRTGVGAYLLRPGGRRIGELGGTGFGPSPFDHLVALGSCAAMTARVAYAGRKK